MSPPRILQLQKIATRWHGQIAKCLKVTEDQILQLPLEETYMLQSTSQPKVYNGSELADLEKSREFLLTPSSNPTDVIILSLTNGSCVINLFSRVDGISMMEAKVLLKLNLKLNLKFRVYEFTLASDVKLRMMRPNHRIESFQFEEKRHTLHRKQEKEEESKQQEADKNGQSISNAVSASILVCMQKFIQTQNEHQKEKQREREEERERRREREKKREREEEN